MPGVLFVSYKFPPVATAGSLRIGGLVKYLPQFGWYPVVITTPVFTGSRPPVEIIEVDNHDVFVGLKKLLIREDDPQFYTGPKSTWSSVTPPTLRNKLLYLARDVLTYPTFQRHWYPGATRACTTILQGREDEIKAVVSSSSPVASHFVAKAVKRRFRIGWIADLRDLWTQNHFYSYGRMRQLMEKRLERKVLTNADALVTVSDPLAEKLKTVYRDAPIHVVRNGFDPDELGNGQHKLAHKFTISYTGHIYHGKQDPTPLLIGIRQLVDSGLISSCDIEVRFFGPRLNWLQELIDAYQLEEIVKQYGHVAREQVLERQRESHLLLLLTWNDPNEVGVYTGKVFEYLAARRPILALGRTGSVVDGLLCETKAGIVVDSDDNRGLREVLLNAYNEFKARGTVACESEEVVIMRYSHYEMARQFSEVLNQVAFVDTLKGGNGGPPALNDR